MVPSIRTTLNGKPVGEAIGSVKMSTAFRRLEPSTRAFRSEAMPDSSQKAKAVPTWMPAAPQPNASASRAGVA